MPHGDRAAYPLLCWRRRAPHSALDERAQDVLQDAAVAVVVGLAGGVDAQDRLELDGLPAVLGSADPDRLRGAALVELGDTGDGERLGAVQAQRLRRLALGELQREHAHAD